MSGFQLGVFMAFVLGTLSLVFAISFYVVRKIEAIFLDDEDMPYAE